MSRTLRTIAGVRTHKSAPSVRQRNERVQRIAGVGYARLQAKGNDIAAALHVHHTSVTHRKAGQGHFARSLLDVTAMERHGIDTSPLLEAMIEAQQEGRAAAAGCLSTLSAREQELNAAEDAGQIAFHNTGCTRRWMQAYVAKLAFVKSRLLPAMRGAL